MTILSAERKTIQEHLWLIDAHLWPKEKGHSWQEIFLTHLCLIGWKFMTIPSAERKTIHDHLWLIDGHFWPKEKVIHAKKNLCLIYVSFHWLKIYDYSKRGAQNHSWTFMAHWCSFLTQRKKSFMTRKIYDHFWPKKVVHAKKNLWLIYDHFWPKKKVIHDKKNYDHFLLKEP